MNKLSIFLDTFRELRAAATRRWGQGVRVVTRRQAGGRRNRAKSGLAKFNRDAGRRSIATPAGTDITGASG